MDRSASLPDARRGSTCSSSSSHPSSSASPSSSRRVERFGSLRTTHPPVAGSTTPVAGSSTPRRRRARRAIQRRTLERSRTLASPSPTPSGDGARWRSSLGSGSRAPPIRGRSSCGRCTATQLAGDCRAGEDPRDINAATAFLLTTFVIRSVIGDFLDRRVRVADAYTSASRRTKELMNKTQ
ncbi:hypothetical protein BE221DRAFT_65582 [Ostreococcus tauri]|uniref:Uncharacterized protein n=1 Tax=Ostreococcus tauri TaxID=70448 RepID=A0A1Y5IHZ7_OSTTA|nr:hypothetical protein BE221DRAFT_65582 [Ostreococcus tauri]